MNELTRPVGGIGQQYTSVSQMTSRRLKADSIAFVVSDSAIQIYSITDTNPGGGLSLPNGNFATLLQMGAPSMNLVSATPTREITAGSTGNIDVINATASQRVRVTFLVSANTTTEAGITIMSGTNTLVDSVTLNGSGSTADIDTDGRFAISGEAPNHQYIEGGLGENITIVKDTGSTTNNLYIAHEIWEES